MIDVNKVVVRGDGLGLVPVNRPASFYVTIPDAQLSDIDVAITSKCTYITTDNVQLRVSAHNCWGINK